MGANRVPDQNNREQLLEYAVQTVTATDGTKMGARAMTLVSSNLPAVEFRIFDALAITDILNHNAQFDPKAYKRVFYYARNTLDQPVTLYVYRPVAGGSSLPQKWSGTAWADDSSVQIPATAGSPSGNHWFLLNTRFSWLGDAQADMLEFRTVCAIAPTVGSVTVVALGVPN